MDNVRGRTVASKLTWLAGGFNTSFKNQNGASSLIILILPNRSVEAAVKMEIQCNNPSLKMRARKKMVALDLDDYMDFLLSHSQLHPTVSFLNQVGISLFLRISFHFWPKIQNIVSDLVCLCSIWIFEIICVFLLIFW